MTPPRRKARVPPGADEQRCPKAGFTAPASQFRDLEAHDPEQRPTTMPGWRSNRSAQWRTLERQLARFQQKKPANEQKFLL
jgi:hypothetical protein